MVAFNKCLWLARRNRETNKFSKEKQVRIIINDDKLIGGTVRKFKWLWKYHSIQHNSILNLIRGKKFSLFSVRSLETKRTAAIAAQSESKGQNEKNHIEFRWNNNQRGRRRKTGKEMKWKKSRANAKKNTRNENYVRENHFTRISQTSIKCTTLVINRVNPLLRLENETKTVYVRISAHNSNKYRLINTTTDGWWPYNR